VLTKTKLLLRSATPRTRASRDAVAQDSDSCERCYDIRAGCGTIRRFPR